MYVVETSGYFDLVGTGAEFTVRQKDYLEAASIWMNSNLLMAKRYPELQIIQSTENGSSPGPNNIVGYKPSTLSNTVESLSEISSGPNRGRIVSEKHNHLDFIAEVQVERPSMILLKTSYHPNWRATVDGMDRPTAMLMPGYIGVYLEPGRHSVVMKYRARVLRPALMWIGFITLIAIGLWLSLIHI